MLRKVSRNARRQDEDLARYYAYRCAVWKAEPPQPKHWKTLATLLGVDRPVLSDFTKGRNGSHARMKLFAEALGPASLEEFEKLARGWAEKYPAWKTGDSLPSPITHTGDPLLDGVEVGATVFSEDLRRAARALPGLMQCTADQARDAAIAAWNSDPNSERTWLEWLVALRGRVDSMRKASHERPSARIKLVT